MSSATGTRAGDALLTQDRFASEHLGRPVYRLRQGDRVVEALAALPPAPRPLMLEARVPTADVAVVSGLTAAGFRLIDTGVQLDVPIGRLALAIRPARGEWRVRDAVPADRASVERVSGENLTTSRFHLDPQIGSEAAARIKRAWASNFFDGRRGDRLLVVEAGGQVGGFLLTLEQGAEGIIDLVALDPVLRGTGALEGLLAGWRDRAPALTHFVVGTQISNVASLRAYARVGFRACAAAYVLHYHA